MGTRVPRLRISVGKVGCAHKGSNKLLDVGLNIFSHFIESLGFHQSTGDPCLYVYYIKGGERILLTIYVDDGLIAATNEPLIDELLDCEFTITSTKNVKNFLGIEICKLKIY